MQSWPSCQVKAICRSVQVDNNGKVLSQSYATGAIMSLSLFLIIRSWRKLIVKLHDIFVGQEVLPELNSRCSFLKMQITCRIIAFY